MPSFNSGTVEPLPVFQPVATVDGWVLEDLSEAVFAQGKQNDVPLIAGTNRDEGTMFRQFFPARTAEAFRKTTRDLYGEHADEILALYPADSDVELAETLNRYLTDTWFVRATRGMLRGMGKVSSPAYQYHFTRTSRAVPALGAHHAAELGYVFNTLAPTNLEDTDHQLAEAMISFWVQFATSGNPNREGLPEWPAWEPAGDQYLELGDKIEVGTALNKEATETLDRIRTAELEAHPESD